MTITIKLMELLKTKPMTATQLADALGLSDNAHSVHNVINTLKRRNGLIVVGRRTELTSSNKRRPCSIYALSPNADKLKIRNPKQSRYKADLSRAIKNHDRYRQALMRHNPQFMLYSKELKLDKGLL